MTLDLRELSRALRPAIPSLPHLRASAIATWRGRMVNEHGSARVFAGLADQLAAAELAVPAAEARVFAEEERRHGVLCGAVVEALGGEACAEGLPEAPFPRHADVPAVEAALRNVLSIGCLSETVAVALIGAERLAMPEGQLRELLSGIYADEVGHARFGWRVAGELTPQLDAAARARLSVYLRVAFGHLETHELRHLPEDARPPAEGAALGLCGGAEAQELFYDTVCGIIAPRLDELGLSGTRAWEMRVTC